ncbi:hypothetical protein A9Q88_11210 [Gammaproteobacteria bacterium 50_400_T64]|nr:hypothetical protein A9Q88_11210 [Gammaproteobacteria bacterium 50_400_T64]
MLLGSANEIAGVFSCDYCVEGAKAKTFQKEQWAALSDVGFLGINASVEYGGAGLGVLERLAEHGIAPLFCDYRAECEGNIFKIQAVANEFK